MNINLYTKAINFSGLAKDKRFTTIVQWIDFVDVTGRPGTVFRGAEIHNEWLEIETPYPRAIMVRGAYGPYESRFPAVQIMVLQKSGYLSKTKIFSDITNPKWEQEIGQAVLSLLTRLSKEKKEGEGDVGELSPGKSITLNCGEKLAIFSTIFPDKSPTEIVEFALDYLERNLLSK